MKLLKCIICGGEVDILFSDKLVNKNVKCRKCGFTNDSESQKKQPEVLIIRKINHD